MNSRRWGKLWSTIYSSHSEWNSVWYRELEAAVRVCVCVRACVRACVCVHVTKVHMYVHTIQTTEHTVHTYKYTCTYVCMYSTQYAVHTHNLYVCSTYPVHVVHAVHTVLTIHTVTVHTSGTTSARQSRTMSVSPWAASIQSHKASNRTGTFRLSPRVDSPTFFLCSKTNRWQFQTERSARDTTWPQGCTTGCATPEDTPGESGSLSRSKDVGLMNFGWMFILRTSWQSCLTWFLGIVSLVAS